MNCSFKCEALFSGIRLGVACFVNHPQTFRYVEPLAGTEIKRTDILKILSLCLKNPIPYFKAPSMDARSDPSDLDVGKAH